MRYTLRRNLSCCLIDGRAIFLDIDKDRYFRLGRALEETFLRYTTGNDLDETRAAALIGNGILVAEPTPAPSPAPECPTPRRSLLELPDQFDSAPLFVLLEVAAIVLRTRRNLKSQALKEIIAAHERNSAQCRKRPASDEAELINAAGAFANMRLQLPIETCCLLDSLALARFLIKRGFTTNIVFGVIDDPFSAHCWVQAGDLVLNDTAGNATSYTPIRVV